MAWVLRREETLEAGSQYIIPEAGLQTRQTEILRKVLEQDLDEDTAAGCGLLFVEMNHGQDMPTNRVVADEVTEELGNVAQFVCFVTMDGIVVLGKGSLEQV